MIKVSNSVYCAYISHITTYYGNIEQKLIDISVKGKEEIQYFQNGVVLAETKNGENFINIRDFAGIYILLKNTPNSFISIYSAKLNKRFKIYPSDILKFHSPITKITYRIDLDNKQFYFVGTDKIINTGDNKFIIIDNEFNSEFSFILYKKQPILIK